MDGANAIDLIVATPDENIALAAYLEALLNSGEGRRIVNGEARGQIQQHLNVGALKAASVPVPPLTLQREFVNHVERIDIARANMAGALAADDELFTSLQSRAFRVAYRRRSSASTPTNLVRSSGIRNS